VPLPEDEEEALAIAIEAAEYVTSRCRSAFADASAAVRRLAESGYVLHTASGEESRELHGYLTGMGLRGYFEHLFGPDLVNAFKAGPVYYGRAFAYCGLEASACVVVDDSPEALAWAAAAGAHTVLVDRDGTRRSRSAGYAIASLEELPALVEKLEADSL
jgi:beta-phosphoglucomutase-like phosphatase (HAD superfamily)